MSCERMIIGVFWDNYQLKNINTINKKLSAGYEIERVDELRTPSSTLIYVLKKEKN